MSETLPEVYLARHGETAWTISHQHTGRSDIPLTERGERNARSLGERLKGTTFSRVLTSPLNRARRTAELAGFGEIAEAARELLEWDYGRYDGLTTAEIRQQEPDWQLFRDGCPGGESVEAVGTRADFVVTRLHAESILAHLNASNSRVLLFGHGHFFRVLAARWLGLPASDGRLLYLSTASLSILGYEHSKSEPVLRLWNDDRHVTWEEPTLRLWNDDRHETS